MKKVILMILAAVVIAVCVCGCARSNDSSFPTMIEKTYYEKTNTASVALANSGINDTASFARETRLVAYTVDRNTPFRVSFLYNDFESGRVYPLPYINGRAEYMNDFEYREMLNADLINATLVQLQSGELKIGDSGDILATIVDWKATDFWGNVEYYSICDFDGDGSWDYITSSTDSSSFMYFTSNISGGNPGRVIDEYNEAGLSTISGEILTLPDLNGKETFKDIEKLL